MKLFVVVIAVAAILGGFVGGELFDRTFSITGAVVGGVGLAAILLGLGAYFDAQDRKRRKAEVPPEVRAVFDRMIRKPAGDPAARQAPSGAARVPPASGGSGNAQSIFFSTAEKLISVQLLPKYAAPKQAFGALMTNKKAAGYLFGFHDALLQRLGLYQPGREDQAAKLIERSFQRLFGEQAGFALYSMCLSSQEDSHFSQGRMSGGTEVGEYLGRKVPPLGLGRILILEAEA